jgi:hypothetical protein
MLVRICNINSKLSRSSLNEIEVTSELCGIELAAAPDRSLPLLAKSLYNFPPAPLAQKELVQIFFVPSLQFLAAISQNRFVTQAPYRSILQIGARFFAALYLYCKSNSLDQLINRTVGASDLDRSLATGLYQ